MPEISYKEFKRQIRKTLWPSGEARNLVEQHDIFFRQAMIELSKWVDPCLRVNNTSVYPACSTYVQCAKTLIPAPNGIIKRVYTIANSDWCDRVFYHRENFAAVEVKSRNLIANWVAPENKSMPALQQGIRFAESSTDSKCGRARVGIWTIHRNQLLVFPWVQSNESVVIEWDGFKTDWKEDDRIDTDQWNDDASEFISFFVGSKHEKFYGSDSKRHAQMTVDADRKLADKIYWCKKKTEGEETDMEQAEPMRSPTSTEVQDDAVVADGMLTLALIGDFGVALSQVLDVANLMKSWKPDHIVLLGDNLYTNVSGEDGGTQTVSAYDVSVGQYFSDYIYGYVGDHGTGALENKCWPIIGNHDRDPAATLNSYYDFFPAILRQPYYDQVFGENLLHCFFLDSGYDNSQVNREADGVNATSAQAEWFQARKLLSTARFKLVFIHHDAWSSTHAAAGGYLQYPELRWDYSGIAAVICGHCHNYERLLGPDGTTFIINGLGGYELKAFDPVPNAPYSKVRYNGDYGAMRIKCDCDQLIMEFINRQGAVIDTVTVK